QRGLAAVSRRRSGSTACASRHRQPKLPGNARRGHAAADTRRVSPAERAGSATNKGGSRDELLECLYTDHRVVTDRTVDSHINNLRHKLQCVSKDGGTVRSIYGVGYKLEL